VSTELWRDTSIILKIDAPLPAAEEQLRGYLE